MSLRLAVLPLAFVATFAHIPDAAAKAYYAPLSEVEDQVDAVAIVDATRVIPVEIRGEHWTYGESVEANVTDVVAGEVTRAMEILGGRDFICAPVRWHPGQQYLALLVRDGEHWTVANNEWGRLEIVDGKVDWPYDDSQDMVALDEIARLLESRLARRLGPGRFAGEPREEIATVEAEVVVATPPVSEEPAPSDVRSPAPWIALGAAAVVFGFVVGTRRRR
jgi:hypothetical protein